MKQPTKNGASKELSNFFLNSYINLCEVFYIKLVIASLMTNGELKLPGYTNGVLEPVKLTSLPQDWV